MSLVFCDSFDTYAAADLPLKYGIVGSVAGFGSIAFGQGRNGSNCLQAVSGPFALTRAVGASATLIMGAAINVQMLSVAAVFKFLDGATTQVSLWLNADGSLSAYLGDNSGTLLGTTGPLIAATLWAYVEFKATFATGATGSVSVHVNGAQVLALTGVQTATTVNASASSVYIGNLAGTSNGFALLDDLYVCNGAGAVNNDCLGDTVIVALLPTANGRVNAFAPSSASAPNYSLINDVPENGDSAYVSAGAVGVEECYALPPLAIGGVPIPATSPPTIAALQVTAIARNAGTPALTLSVGVGNGQNESYDAGVTPSSAYGYVERVIEQNPFTSASFALADFTTLQLALATVTGSSAQWDTSSADTSAVFGS